jgi:plastocyanin
MAMKHVKSRRGAASGERRRTANNFALLRRATVTCITLVLLSGFPSYGAADISVVVVDRDGHGVSEVAVTAMPAAPATGPSAVPKSAVMDQRHRAFVPLVLVVGVGTTVEFPNNDSVSHQVYSFSPAKRFQLPLYKGEAHSSVIFDQTGLVVLGCNIHDEMVGYIYVTDTAYFGTTDANGGLQFKNPAGGDYRIAIWSPYIADAPASLVRTIHVAAYEPATARIQLSLPLRALPEPRPRRRDWEY